MCRKFLHFSTIVSRQAKRQKARPTFFSNGTDDHRWKASRASWPMAFFSVGHVTTVDQWRSRCECAHQNARARARLTCQRGASYKAGCQPCSLPACHLVEHVSLPAPRRGRSGLVQPSEFFLSGSTSTKYV